LWDLYEAGESQRSIGSHLGRSPSTVRTQLVSAGWRRPTPPPEWCLLRLSRSEREEISRGLARDESLRSIACRLGRSPSTVPREVRINGGHLGYRATVAHRASRLRAKRPKPMKLTECPRLRGAVETKLELWWSPSQISRWLIRTYRDDEEMRVSHETIYQSLFVHVVGETIIYTVDGFSCPLTELAESAGAETGSVTDIYLPVWLARRLTAIHIPLAAVILYLHRDKFKAKP
jgi:DNA-binding CsgD family transcriptional regulator